MVRVVFFDIDGTLVHTGRAGVKAFARVFATEFGAQDGTERMKFAGRTDVSLVREFFRIHAIEPSAANFQRFFDRYAFWLDHLIAECAGAPCRGILDFLDGLQALPNPPLLGLLTGNIRLGAEIKLRHFDLWELFVTGGFADDHEDRNGIAAAAYRRARRLLGDDLRPEEVVVVGDTPWDIQCGRSIGARVLAVATGGATLEELAAHHPDWAVEDLTRLQARVVCNGHAGS
ncbi:MAG: HAD hydrolase-like protein [Verrucomicrobia bacterium]|jgi:phosphoglycolate phosphatase-like HAD superfamily hydrolase|nr:HAD hydrolase-like protein [Verrucomicrobiota bacterium]